MKTSKFLFAAAALLAAVTSIQAQVLIGNLPINGLNTDDAFAAGVRYAVGFQTGATGYGLGSIKLDLSSGTSAILDIRTETDGLPSGVSGFSTFGAPTISGNTYTFVPSSSFSLAPFTHYWVVVGASGAGTWLRDSITAGTYTSTFGFSSLGSANSSSGGLTWGTFPSSGNPGMAITAVPEPSEYAMLAGIALLGFAVWRRTMAVKAA